MSLFGCVTAEPQMIHAVSMHATSGLSVGESVVGLDEVGDSVVGARVGLEVGLCVGDTVGLSTGELVGEL
eukprot:CAMPEP_0172441048 /NCGR_PEP_ID=MMETSP1065-20121228/1624_1 /TAXON_ID=265537 /ORGANISM="Amphiprora paludosa, Strain CCMP125" /LENGTH=69 /DNA_ID=CAMNT_0013190199 /DNA_START=156 /DNA_END=361 /DNA_ORIENTATION=-